MVEMAEALMAANLVKGIPGSAAQRAEAAAIQAEAEAALVRSAQPALRVATLDGTPLAAGSIVEAVGIPVYVDDVAPYAAYGITDKGWYLFARITAPEGVTAGSGTAVTGAAGSIVEAGADHVDVAVRFDVAAESNPVTVAWSQGITDRFVFRATDLAVRNLDYRTTFYVYDLAPYVSWEYALTTDETFVAGSRYFTKSGDVYTEAMEGTDWTVGAAVPAETYYKRSGGVIAGMIKNVTYKLDEVVDCGLTVQLPEVADNGYGCWFEFQLRHSGSASITMNAPTGVKVATAGASAAIAAGVNVVDFHYTKIDGVALWTLANVNTKIPE